MRLWHQDLIPLLPRQQLLGQHRECCALRGNGWGKKHSTVDYVFEYAPPYLALYHALIINEMTKRGYSVNKAWHNWRYRGKICFAWSKLDLNMSSIIHRSLAYPTIYPEHNREYLIECIDNLRNKGVDVSKMELLVKEVS